MSDRDILTGLTKLQVLAEIEDVIRSMPQRDKLHWDSPDILAWCGRATAAMHNWDGGAGRVAWDFALHDLRTGRASANAPARIITMLHQAQSDLRMKTIGPINVAIGQGQVFAYMETMRKLIQMANSDLLFVDRYIDGGFVSDYLPHITAGVRVRILTRRDKQTAMHLATLLPMAKAYATQYSQRVEIRSHNGFHDRLLMTDGINGYASSCSFKDGPRTAGATITQHEVSIFSSVKHDNEALWTSGTVEL